MNEHKEASIISEKVAEEIKYLEGIGYSVKKNKKWYRRVREMEVTSFFFFILFPIYIFMADN